MKFRALMVALVAVATLAFVLLLKQAPSEDAGNAVSLRSGESSAEASSASGPAPVSTGPENDIAKTVAKQEDGHPDGDQGNSDAIDAPRIAISDARIEDLFFTKPNARASFGLPGGREAIGIVEYTLESDGATVFVQGRIKEPQPGFFFFRKQTEPGVAGSMTGVVRFDEGEIAYRVEPLGASGEPIIVQRSLDEVICREYDEQAAERASPLDPAEGDVATSVPQLESLPGAKAVAYLDFDGEEGPHNGWGDFYAEPWVGTAEEMTECWRQVAENFAPFHINITTKLEVYLAAPEASRIRCIMTPTGDAAPGAGGVAYIGSFNWTGDTPCWAFNGGPVGSAMTAAHEIGHTFGLAHDGTISGGGGYYGGHGSPFEVSWGPIMGAPFGANLIQWSKGEYFDADQTQDDLAIIVGDNNRMDYRADDHGGTLATATALQVDAAGAFNMPGIIERNSDFDSFVFSTAGGTLNVVASTYSDRPNLDILLELRNSSGVLVTSSNPDTQVTAGINQSLSAGTYELRISGVGRGDPLGDGYTDYGCMGHYTLSGSVGNAGYLMTVPRAAINGYVVGTLARGVSGTYAIIGGTDAAAFSVDSASGVVTVSDASLLSKYSYSFLASTPSGPVAVTVNSAPSDIVVDVWGGIGGNNVSDLTGSAAYSGPPTEKRAVSELDLQGFYDDYGERVRAYLVVPVSGTYHFWIASDDASQLWLSTDDQPVNAQLIAYENGVSGQYNWTAHASQASVSKTLTAGQRYYLEVLHKEGVGGDYVAVAWQGPGISQTILPASALVPFGNRAPLLVNLDVSIQETAAIGTLLATMEAVDPDAGDTHTFSILSGNGAGLFQIDPSRGEVELLGALEESDTVTHVLTIRATDSAGNTADGTLSIHVVEPGAKLEIYDGIGGADVDNLVAAPNYPNSPSRTEYLPTLEFQDRGDNYGSRMQAYLRVPETGDYIFWVAGDDDTELHLSTDANPANATRIARTDGYTDFRQWTKYATQQSSVLTLQAGTDYYIAVLHKEAAYGDHASVAIAGPGFERTVIPERLLSWEIDARAPTLADASFGAPKQAPAGTVIGTLDFYDPDAGTQPVYTILSGDPYGLFAVNPDGGVALAKDGYRLLGPAYNLVVQASDGTLSDTADITVQVIDGGVMLERWDSIAGEAITDLTGPGKYPSNPDATEALGSLEFQNKGDNYGSVMTANVTVPATGDYRFWIAGDDAAELWISTDGNPANRQLFARTIEWNEFRGFDESTGQRSQLVNLQGGSSIYIEVLQKEGAGGDHASVAWEGPGIARTVITAPATLKRYTSLEGERVQDLTGVLAYDPDKTSFIAAFEYQSLGGGSYGARAGGYLTIPTTGTYTFWIASDDQSELWISPDGDPANKSKAAEALAYTSFRDYDANASQQSPGYALNAGDVVYLESLHIQGVGGDHLSVAWQGPGISRTPIPGSALSPVLNPLSGPVDSDGDGVADAVELAKGTDPGSSASTPGAAYAGLLAWLPLEEGGGSATADLSGYGYNGSLVADADWTTGLVGDHAITCDGTGDYVALPPLGISTDTATVSGWAKRNGSQNLNAGLVFTRQNFNETASGIWVNGSELGYQWNDQYFGVSSGLHLPDGEWAFFALTVAPDRAVLYLGLPDGSWSSFTNIAPHAVDDFFAPTRIGSDELPSRDFRGDIDDVRIFDHALSGAEVQSIFRAHISPPISEEEIGGSSLSFQRISGENADLYMSIVSSVAGHTYQVEYSTDLLSGSWTPIGAAQAGTGEPLEFTIPVTLEESSYYRIRITR